MSTLGDRLKGKRRESKLTQKDVAIKLGIDNTTVSKWESGTYEPDAAMLKKLAELYNINGNYLLGLIDDTTGDIKNKESYNDADTTIRLINEEAEKMGLSPTDPIFKKMLSDAFELLRMARGKDMK